jgi:putative PIN family toxin of toxin-antitoxin system
MCYHISMKVVVDTNIVVSAIMSPDGAARRILRLCFNGLLTPIIGNALFAEYEDVCSREQLFSKSLIDQATRNELVDALVASCEWIPIYYLWRPNLRDEADNHLVELAIGGGAVAIITSNKKDFANSQLAFPHLKVETAGEFLLRGSFQQ